MKVDRAKALRLEHEGRTYYFCSEHCMTRFQAERADAGSQSVRARA